MSNYYNPVKIIQTNNWRDELNRYIENFNISSPIIITSEGNRNRLNLDSIFDPLCIYSNVSSNPTFDDCNSAIKFCKDNYYDGVIALGGGSVMDLAKVIMAHICLEKTNIFKLIEYKQKFSKLIPSIFIPTTHGTASEVTMWGTIWNMNEKKKYSISHTNLYPRLAILDGTLTMSLPLDLSIITTMDALSHSFESIWNKNSNKVSTEHAIDAITIILNNVKLLKENHLDIKVRNNLLYASTKAGLAFSNTKTAAAHSMSYPLTINFGVPHGIASSISLLPLLEINKKLIKEPLEMICMRNELTYDELIIKIKNIPNNILPFTLNELGIYEKELPKLVEESFTKGRMENNIVDLSIEQIHSIFEKIF